MLGYVWLFFCLVLFMFVHCFQFCRGTLWSNLATNSNKFIQQCCIHQSSIQKPKKNTIKWKKWGCMEALDHYKAQEYPRISIAQKNVETDWTINFVGARTGAYGIYEAPVSRLLFPKYNKKPNARHHTTIKSENIRNLKFVGGQSRALCGTILPDLTTKITKTY